MAVEDIGKLGGDEPGREIATGFAVCRAAADKIDEARQAGRFPIVLAGNCLTAVGSVAGEAADSIIWIDQHGDLNTPETSTTGFLDGMALATILGMCWHPLAAMVPGFSAIDPSRCLLMGVRDLDQAEKDLLAKSPIITGTCAEAADTVERLRSAGARRAHLHIDLDVHNPDELQVNRYAHDGGPNPEQLRKAVCGLARGVPVVGVTITAYDPAFDAKGDVPPVVGELLDEFLATLEQI